MMKLQLAGWLVHTVLFYADVQSEVFTNEYNEFKIGIDTLDENLFLIILQ